MLISYSLNLEKMQYNALTPVEYLDVLEDDWRKATLLQIRTLIEEKAAEFEERINYKMLCYTDKKGDIFHLNAQKNYVSLYVGDTAKIDPNGSMLKGLNLGKGCIRFKKSVKVSDTKIDQFIEKAVALWKDGEDLGG